MDWGLSNRLARIIKSDTGKTVMLAVDHGYFLGPTSGLEIPSKIIKPLRMLFSEILRNLSANKRQGQPKIDLAKWIETELIDKIEQMNGQSEFPLNPSSTALT